MLVNDYKYNSYLYKSSLTSKQQADLYEDYIKTGNVDSKSKIAISYVCFISKLVKNSPLPDKEDAISELLMIVYNAIDKYDKTKASIYTYTYRIIKTKLIDRIRALNTVKKYVSDTDVDSMLMYVESAEENCHDDSELGAFSSHILLTSNEIMTRDDNSVINRAINLLDSEEKQLILMRYYNSSSISKIMSKLNINRKKYGEIESSAMEKLKQNRSLKGIINDR